MLTFFFCVEIGLEDWTVAVGEKEATKKGARGTPGPKPFKGGEHCC